LLCFLCFLCFPASLFAQSFDIQKVADGIYAAIPKPGRFVGANAAFIVDRDEVLVVDAHYTPSAARQLIAEIKKVTPLPVRYVVNTHWHPDHVQGNQAYVGSFGPNVEYISQHLTRQDIIIGKALPSIQDQLKSLPKTIADAEVRLAAGKDEQGQPLSDEQRQQITQRIADLKSYLEELQTIQPTLPTITFERSLILHRPSRDIYVLYYGKGHTRGDVVVYLPREKVVVTGDLLTNGIPFMRDAYPVEWVETLRSLERLDFETAIPGHGSVQQGKKQLGRLISFLAEVVAAVKEAVVKGQTLDDLKKGIDLTQYQSDFPNFKTGAPAMVERTYLEVTGKIAE
jgi:glyoxylase-like metal-dependent hydrolase (beta-lactamase superfamily II)